MRIETAVLFAACILCAGKPAWSQLPAPPEAPSPGAPPVAPPPPPPPFANPPPLALPSFMPALPPPMQTALPPLAQPASERPLDLTGRVGFGFGLWAAPVGLAGQGAGGVGALGGLGAYYGGALSIRWWLRDRFFLMPSLRLGISYSTVPDEGPPYQSNVKGGSFTNGTFAPALSLGFAAYRGKSTRFLLSGGLSFGYTVDETVTQTKDLTGSYTNQYEASKTLFFAVPVGFALEQFFSPRISIIVGADSPLFSYNKSAVGNRSPTTSIGADFASTRLSGAVVFYTD